MTLKADATPPYFLRFPDGKMLIQVGDGLSRHYRPAEPNEKPRPYPDILTAALKSITLSTVHGIETNIVDAEGRLVSVTFEKKK